VTLTLTLDRATWYTVVHHSSTPTYTPNFIQIGGTFVDVRTYGQTSRPALLDLLLSLPKDTPQGFSWIFKIRGGLAHYLGKLLSYVPN